MTYVEYCIGNSVLRNSVRASEKDAEVIAQKAVSYAREGCLRFAAAKGLFEENLLRLKSAG